MPIDRQRLLPIARGMQGLWCVGRVGLGRPRGLSTLTVFGTEGPCGAWISLGIGREGPAEMGIPLALRQKLSMSTAP